MQYISQVNYLSIEGVVIKEGRSSGDADASPHHSRMTVKAGTRAAVCLLLQEACRSRRRSTGVERRQCELLLKPKGPRPGGGRERLLTRLLTNRGQEVDAPPP